MRLLMILVAATIAGGTAAEAKCRSGSADLIRLVGWKAVASPGGVELTLEYENVSGKPIRMLDATVWFTDALGAGIGGAGLKRDHNLLPNAKEVEVRKFIGFERLPNLRQQDAAAVLCTSAVLFEDGEKKSYK